jgi:hypothetical protein
LAADFNEAGFPNALVLDGGVLGWRNTDFSQPA